MPKSKQAFYLCDKLALPAKQLSCLYHYFVPLCTVSHALIVLRSSKKISWKKEKNKNVKGGQTQKDSTPSIDISNLKRIKTP